jgi:excinuclease ABC subunit A
MVTRCGAHRDDRPGDGRIEHTRQRDVIKTADWVLDLGPEGGDKGGEIVAEGTPEQVAAEAGSYTGDYLKQLLNCPRAEHAPQRRKKARASASMREREAAE